MQIVNEQQRGSANQHSSDMKGRLNDASNGVQNLDRYSIAYFHLTLDRTTERRLHGLRSSFAVRKVSSRTCNDIYFISFNVLIMDYYCQVSYGSNEVEMDLTLINIGLCFIQQVLDTVVYNLCLFSSIGINCIGLRFSRFISDLFNFILFRIGNDEQFKPQNDLGHCEIISRRNKFSLSFEI